MNHYVLGFDGFLQRERPLSFDEARKQWQQAIKNRYLYQYDCSVYEVDAQGNIQRNVPYEELTA